MQYKKKKKKTATLSKPQLLTKKEMGRRGKKEITGSGRKKRGKTGEGEKG